MVIIISQEALSKGASLGLASHPPHDIPRSQGRLIRSTIETRRTSIRLRGMQRQTAPSVILRRDSQPHVAARQAQLQRPPSRRPLHFRSLGTVGERVALQKVVLRGFRAPTHRIHDRDSSTTRRCRPPQTGQKMLMMRRHTARALAVRAIEGLPAPRADGQRTGRCPGSCCSAHRLDRRPNQTEKAFPPRLRTRRPRHAVS